jgi:hypothetical protein
MRFSIQQISFLFRLNKKAMPEGMTLRPVLPARQLFTAFRLKQCFGVRILFGPLPRDTLAVRVPLLYDGKADLSMGKQPGSVIFLAHYTKMTFFSRQSDKSVELVLSFRPSYCKITSWVFMRTASF